MVSNQRPYVVAITGASGAIYGIRLVRALIDCGMSVALTISETAKIVMGEELGIRIDDLRCPDFLKEFFGQEWKDRIFYYHYQDFTAPIASGSYPHRGMMIVPASTTCFSRIANGISETLVERAAECTIKEGRKLVVVPRETPMSVIHLEQLLTLARAGVKVLPAIPAFYSGVKTIEEMVDFIVGKILDQFEIDHQLYPRWIGGVQNLKTEGFSWTEKLT